jgi:Domain of unknown function (DUF4337)
MEELEAHEAIERHEKLKEAAESAEEARREEGFVRRAALLVAFLAALLAIASLLGSEADGDVLLSQERATDTFNEYQADSLKQRLGTDIANVLTALNRPGQAADAQKDADTKGALKAGLLAQANRYQAERDAAAIRHRSYQFAQGAFQIAIVLTSIAIVARVAALAVLGGGLGAAGLLLLLNGYFSVVKLAGGA